MITVRVYGLLRLDSGISRLKLEADSVRELLSALPADLGPDKTRNCLIMVNGKEATLGTKLKDGDELYLMSSVAGG